jgi:hypothetical protein
MTSRKVNMETVTIVSQLQLRLDPPAQYMIYEFFVSQLQYQLHRKPNLSPEVLMFLQKVHLFKSVDLTCEICKPVFQKRVTD